MVHTGDRGIFELMLVHYRLFRPHVHRHDVGAIPQTYARKHPAWNGGGLMDAVSI